ncbi:hypothetical protein R0C99_20505, partial [Escherichia coli]|uniref:hypothetical protein n=1 Tax=Escherichia coli TaxID=562 RepID=UPI00396E77EB
WKGWAILLRQKQKKLIMLPSETMIWQPEFTDKTLSRKPGAVQVVNIVRNKLIIYLITEYLYIVRTYYVSELRRNRN